MASELELADNYEDMFINAVNNGVQYLCGYMDIKSLIIGLSGGIDSALSCVIARKVCNIMKSKKGRSIELRGYSLPLASVKEETMRARKIGTLCHMFEEVTLIDQYLSMLSMIDQPSGKIRKGNVKARLRMMYLYDKSSEFDGIVLSTDNLTEYYTGFWTLHGDVGDLGLVQNLWKTEIYGVSEYYTKNYKSDILRESIDAVPTDGLGITDTDLDQLLPNWNGNHEDGYRCVDEALIRYITRGQAGGSVISRHTNTMFKRCNPFNPSRASLLQPVHPESDYLKRNFNGRL